MIVDMAVYIEFIQVKFIMIVKIASLPSVNYDTPRFTQGTSTNWDRTAQKPDEI